MAWFWNVLRLWRKCTNIGLICVTSPWFFSVPLIWSKYCNSSGHWCVENGTELTLISFPWCVYACVCVCYCHDISNNNHTVWSAAYCLCRSVALLFSYFPCVVFVVFVARQQYKQCRGSDNDWAVDKDSGVLFVGLVRHLKKTLLISTETLHFNKWIPLPANSHRILNGRHLSMHTLLAF